MHCYGQACVWWLQRWDGLFSSCFYEFLFPYIQIVFYTYDLYIINNCKLVVNKERKSIKKTISAFQDMATEIILTLGQAFEVAYQMAIREKPARSGTKGSDSGGTAPCGDDPKRYVSQITVHLVQKTPEKKSNTELKIAADTWRRREPL